MREYESIFIMEPEATDADIDIEVEKIRDIVGQESGEITEVQKWGRRKLAYDIRKKTEGVYTLVRFQAGNDSLIELNRRFRMNESLLRYMTVEYEGPFPGEFLSGGEGEGEDTKGAEPQAAEAPAENASPEPREGEISPPMEAAQESSPPEAQEPAKDPE